VFKRKEKESIETPIKEIDYTKWEQELGFLNLLMVRKKNITKEYFISIYNTQLKDTDFIRDEDLEEIMLKSIYEVFNEIAPAYKKHLTTKFFGSEEELLKFIAEDFYVELTSAAVLKNKEKIKILSLKQKVENLQEFRRTDIEESK